MLVSETSNLLSTRLESLEFGVKNLDTRVSVIDDKLTHVIQMNSELMNQTGELAQQSRDNYRGLHSQLEDTKREMKKSINQIRVGSTSKCQIIAFGLGTCVVDHLCRLGDVVKINPNPLFQFQSGDSFLCIGVGVCYVDNILRNAARIFSTFDVYVSINAPSGAPGVFDDPSRVCESNNGDCVIDIFPAHV